MRRRHPARRRFFVSIRCSVRSPGWQMRARERYNQSEVLILLTATDKNGEIPPLEKLKNIMTVLKEAISETLRRNDIVARYSPSQFILGLLVAEEENGQLVANRIRNAFEAKCRRKGEIYLKEQMISLRAEDSQN